MCPKNKAVIMLSSMHHVAKIGDGVKNKPEIIEFYNWSNITGQKLVLTQWIKCLVDILLKD